MTPFLIIALVIGGTFLAGVGAVFYVLSREPIGIDREQQ